MRDVGDMTVRGDMQMPSSDIAVDILLATYNGERFLPELLESIANQDYANWRLICRDDGSSDATLRLLTEFSAAYPGRVEIHLRPQDAAHGAAMNFSSAAALSRAAYAMFADQDDQWLADKISVTLAAMRDCEMRHGASTPILVHTDLEVVSEDLSSIAPSFTTFQHLEPLAGAALPRLLVRNVVTGCTAMMNAALRDLAFPLPPHAIMHDWWTALVAAAFGKVVFVPRATIRYRQHGGNAVGAQGWGAKLWRSRLASLKENRRRTRAKFRQAEALLEFLPAPLPVNTEITLRGFVRLYRQTSMVRKLSWLTSAYRDTGFLRNLGLFVSL